MMKLKAVAVFAVLLTLVSTSAYAVDEPLTAALSPQANAENWQPITGADALQQLVSGATAEIELQPGVTAVGKYHADGTAEIEAWNETVRRTWEVKGDDQVCYTGVKTNCYSFEKNLDDTAEFRASNVESGEVVVFRVTDAETDTFTGRRRLLRAAKADLVRRPQRRSPQRCRIQTPIWVR